MPVIRNKPKPRRGRAHNRMVRRAHNRQCACTRDVLGREPGTRVVCGATGLIVLK